MKEQATQAERVLSFWHKVEFFESTELTDIKNGKDAIYYRSDELINAPDGLPWLNREHLRRAGKHYRLDAPYRFKLYLGLFKRSRIFEIAREAYPDQAGSWVEREERSNDGGLTCSLSVNVDEQGKIDPDSFAISTAPWVLGALQQGRLDQVTREAFEAATEVFRQRLGSILTVADNLKQEHGLPPMLTTFELIEMLKAMAVWTSFTPGDDNSPALVVQVLTGDRAGFAASAPPAPEEAWQRLAHLSQELDIVCQEGVLGEGARQQTADDESPPMQIDELAILNSFFIDDLETVITHLRKHGLTEGSPLACYLQGAGERYPDLLLPKGRSLLMRQLAPSRMPLGRWPGEDEHSMSLMQQFAINSIDTDLDERGLYSVNGPPGTGKTTMLRDLVARNVVKRAEVLAALESVGAAFDDDLRATIDGELRTVRTLIPALTGFEMVVVSSNNAAVENITKELPQRKALGDAYSEMAYLKPAAQKLAAEHGTKENGSVNLSPLNEEETCWGLIATALGKKTNRDRFGSRLFYKSMEKCSPEGDAVNYRTLIPALKALASGRDTLRDFKDAQRTFKAARAKVEHILEELERLQDLERQAKKVQAQRDQVERCRLEATRLELWFVKRQARRIGIWPLKRYLTHRALLKRLRQKKNRVEKTAALSKQRADALERQLEKARKENAHLYERYSDALLPDETLDLEASHIQRTSFGHCQALNQARSQLTARAFELHQAWLVAAYDDKAQRLHKTLFSLMPAIDGKVLDRDAAKALWQMLFLIVPVISSTFASVAKQFRALKEGDIGWLFVDEAGQATPQQAVGALWRAKRAVVVGDPLQIEPVFTVPPELVDTLAKGEFAESWYQWSPTVASVQTVADRANSYGTHQIADDLWVGSPLRVHRRCAEPMFSIANAIAYNGKMLHGNPDLPDGPGDSRWINIAGKMSGKHFVPRQAESVHKLLLQYIDREKEIPPVYIISPFKAVARGIQHYLEQHLPAECFGGQDKLRSWLKEHVGTVHTFQGKEEERVILVLGLSEDAPGAAEWASSKPNLLNVALTRAKKRVYVIGSVDIWAGKKYFSEACKQLPVHNIQ